MRFRKGKVARGTLAFLLVVGSRAHAQSEAPDAARLEDFIARMRQAALSYSTGLKDFVCTEIMKRSVDDSGKGVHWKPLETQEIELTYAAGKENYKLLSVNGSSKNAAARVKQGYFSPRGEFGTALQRVFAPEVKAEFEWDHAETGAGNPLWVFRYRVPVETSTMVLRFDLARARQSHHGLVYAHPATGVILRVRIETDPAEFPYRGRTILAGTNFDVRYGYARIASGEFLVPKEAVVINRLDKRLTKAEISFELYRKYQSQTTITFDPDRPSTSGK